MSNDQNTILVSERYNRMISAIEDYVQAEKLATRRYLEDRLNREKKEALEAMINASIDRSRLERDCINLMYGQLGPMMVSVTGAAEEDEYNGCEHCACKGEN